MNRSLRAIVGAGIFASVFLLGACGSSTDDEGTDTETTTGDTTEATTEDTAEATTEDTEAE